VIDFRVGENRYVRVGSDLGKLVRYDTRAALAACVGSLAAESCTVTANVSVLLYDIYAVGALGGTESRCDTRYSSPDHE